MFTRDGERPRLLGECVLDVGRPRHHISERRQRRWLVHGEYWVPPLGPERDGCLLTSPLELPPPPPVEGQAAEPEHEHDGDADAVDTAAGVGVESVD